MSTQPPVPETAVPETAPPDLAEAVELPALAGAPGGAGPAALLAGDPRVGLDPRRVATLSARAGNTGVARMLGRQPAAAPPKPAVAAVGQVKHTFTIPDKKLGGAKDVGYAQAQFKIGANVDLEITPVQAATAPDAPGGDVTLKGSGGVNAGDGTKYQAEVTAEFDKRVGGILDGCTPKAKVGGEVGAQGSKLGLEVSLEGQRFEPKFGFTVFDVNKEDGIKFATLEAAVDWKIQEWSYKASDGADIKITPKATPKLAIEPNYKRILQALLEEGVEGAATLTLDAALLAGPPLLAGIVIAQGIYMAGEKGELHKHILEGAVDARQAAMSYAQVMTGSDQQGVGPRSTAAVAKAKEQINGIAGRSKVSVEELMAELRKNAARDFVRVHAQTRQEVFSTYQAEVRKVIRAWRAEHYILAWWTEEADDVEAAMRQVDVVFSH
ncbi:MAG TPA: hypothetical protein PKD59_14070 [Miltoncostaeaceae bacterium]|nr:hypothetical protein [Miltoncostaeaceae bacterium]